MKKAATLPPSTQQDMAVHSELFLWCLFLESTFICSLLQVVLRRFSGSEEVMVPLFGSIRSSQQGAGCWQGGASSLTVAVSVWLLLLAWGKLGWFQARAEF